MSRLILLQIDGNNFTGTLPAVLPLSLRISCARDCNLQDEIPKGIDNLKKLTFLDLTGNKFCGINSFDDQRLSGRIPECIGNLKTLQELSLDANELSSTVPQSLWSLDQLIYLGLSYNLLHGNLGKNFTTMKSLTSLYLSWNKFSGNIPASLGYCQSLTYLRLSHNSFSGPIPESFGNLISLVNMDLSSNNLSGQIPKSLETLKYLKDLNLSYNNLSVGLVVAALFYVFRKCRIKNLNQSPENALQEQRIISYHELSHATNGLSEANFLGSRGFGQVYKGVLSDGKIVAVKLLNLVVDGAINSFDAECKALRTIRHRNLVKVISMCTNNELRILVLEYIPNGSLEKWLYSHNYCLSFLQRVSIMLDVAMVMDYLHFGQSDPVIHCDLKPGNVLLDENMVAHVGDFGITKILAENKTETLTSTFGSCGYIAPEYGMEGRVSIKGDSYSYGIMLLETFTRKKPTDEMFTEYLSFRQWVSNGKMGVIDENLQMADAQGKSAISSQNILLALLDLGLGCSRDSPEERFDMRDVVTKLNKIKLQILSE